MMMVVAEFRGRMAVGEAEPAPEGEALPRDRCQLAGMWLLQK